MIDRLLRPVAPALIASPEKAARTTVMLAVGSALAGSTGGFYAKSEPRTSSKRSRDPSAVDRVYGLTDTAAVVRDNKVVCTGQADAVPLIQGCRLGAGAWHMATFFQACGPAIALVVFGRRLVPALAVRGRSGASPAANRTG